MTKKAKWSKSSFPAGITTVSLVSACWYNGPLTTVRRPQATENNNPRPYSVLPTCKTMKNYQFSTTSLLKEELFDHLDIMIKKDSFFYGFMRYISFAIFGGITRYVRETLRAKENSREGVTGSGKKERRDFCAISILNKIHFSCSLVERQNIFQIQLFRRGAS